MHVCVYCVCDMCLCVCVCIRFVVRPVAARSRRSVGRRAATSGPRMWETGCTYLVVPTLDHKSFWMPVKINDKKKTVRAARINM